MFPLDTLLAYLAACLIVVVSPGPDNLLAIGRGLSQGRMAAALSALGAGLGILCHTLAATFDLSLLVLGSAQAFWVVKAVGALYLIWLGGKALLAGWLQARPRVVRGMNVGAGLTFIAAGLSVLTLKQRGMS